MSTLSPAGRERLRGHAVGLAASPFESDRTKAADLTAALSEIDRLSSAQAKTGYVLVPVEPTDEMLAAADTAIPRFEAELDGTRVMGVDGALDAWRAMLSAAPLRAEQ